MNKPQSCNNCISKSRMSRLLGTTETSLDTNDIEAMAKAFGMPPDALIKESLDLMAKRESYALAAESDSQEDLDEGDLY